MIHLLQNPNDAIDLFADLAEALQGRRDIVISFGSDGKGHYTAARRIPGIRPRIRGVSRHIGEAR